MRWYGPRLEVRGPRAKLLGCLLLFYLIWITVAVWRSPHVPRYAYATFLSEPYVKEGENATEVDDGYYLGTRVMIHRLLHSEVAGNYPVVVMVTSNVSQEKQQRLKKDGAIVVAVDAIEAEEWYKPNEPRWHNMMTKLKLFDLTEYDKICYMDSDILIRINIDLIFETDAAAEQTTLSVEEQAEGLPPLPTTYVMATHADSYGYAHPFSVPSYFNAGFMIFKPSRLLYDYYLALSKIEGLFKTGMMEQDLLNYAHRPSGNMPWQKVWENWNMDHPVEADWEHGVFTYHDKYWEHSDERNPRFLALWNQHLGEMKGYWRTIEKGAAPRRGPNRWIT